jgi:uncharacterized membrane protein
MESPTPTAAAPAPRTPPETPAWPRAPRALAAGRGLEWWTEGWRVFTAAPLVWIGMLIALVVMMAVLHVVPVLGNLAQIVLWPVIAGGLFLGCHALARGRPLEFSHLFAGFNEGRAGGLMILGLVSMAVTLAFAMLIMLFIFGAGGMSVLAAVMHGDASTALAGAIAGISMAALVVTPVVIVLATLFLMAWWFAAPLVAINRAPPFDALKASFDASWKNIGALTVFGLVYLVLAIVASIPFGLGWLVLGPVAIGANYASWREVYGD